MKLLHAKFCFLFLFLGNCRFWKLVIRMIAIFMSSTKSVATYELTIVLVLKWRWSFRLSIVVISNHKSESGLWRMKMLSGCLAPLLIKNYRTRWKSGKRSDLKIEGHLINISEQMMKSTIVLWMLSVILLQWKANHPCMRLLMLLYLMFYFLLSWIENKVPDQNFIFNSSRWNAFRSERIPSQNIIFSIQYD